LTYVPPEKKQKGGTSGFGDIIYVFLFYLIEGMFIFIGIPVIIIAIAAVPVSMYLIITEGEYSEWPIYVIGGAIVFFQIIGVQFFVRKFILEPHKMTFGEWLRWKFSPTLIKQRREERKERSRKMDEWYQGMDRIHERKEQLKEEQQYNIRAEWFGERDPEFIDETPQEDVVIIGETPIIETTIEESAEPDESYSFSEPAKIEDEEELVITLKSEEDQEE